MKIDADASQSNRSSSGPLRTADGTPPIARAAPVMTILDGASGGLEEIQGTAKSGDLMATDEIDIDT
jgi:hypothetical protein